MIAAKKNLQILVAGLCGAVFALGLAISGMTLPTKVRGFLDITGDWDPTLAFVMGGAVIVYAAAYFLVSARRAQPLFGGEFHLPLKRQIDARLILGAALFGIGWGISGLCPGPAVVAMGTGLVDLFVFLGALLAGMYIFRGLAAPRG